MNESSGINVLSLFNGLSCGHLALDKIGMKVDKYYSSEIDKHAIQVCQYNYPETVQLGDVTKWREWDIEWKKIDLVLAGSPCQGFSFAGKQLAFDDPRSKLFFVFVEILEYIKSVNPKVKWLLENVRMKKEHEYVISKTVGIEPVIINSALLSAQNRVRLYWTNFYTKKKGLFETEYCAIPPPKDLGIMLKDVLEAEVDEKYYLSKKSLQSLQSWQSRNKENGNGFKAEIRFGNDKAATLSTGSQKSSSTYFSEDFVKIDKNGNIKSNQDKASCFTAGGNSGGNHSDMDLICVASVQKDNLVMQLNPSTESGGVQPYQQNRVYDIDGISPALMAQMSCGTHAILEKSPCFEHGTNGQLNKQLAKGGLIRRLTPTECARLQTIPDGYFINKETGKYIVSETQVYRQCGNGWTVDVIAYLLSFMNK